MASTQAGNQGVGWAPTLGVSTNCYHGYSLEEALAGIARSGFRGVEIGAVVGWNEHLTPGAAEADLESFRAALTRHGLQLISMSGHSDLTTPEGVAQYKRALDSASALGITIVNTGIGGHEGGGEDVEAFLKNIPEVADYAAQRGLVVALETHGSGLSTGREGVELVRRIDRPNVRINYDTANVIFYGDVRPEEDIVEAIPLIANVHLKDARGGKGVWDFPALGEGKTDFERILRSLHAGGYNGPLSLEIEFQGLPWPPLEEVDRSVRASYDHLQGLLKQIG
jgi:sugar phosphate isomerase/epimerase